MIDIFMQIFIKSHIDQNIDQYVFIYKLSDLTRDLARDQICGEGRIKTRAAHIWNFIWGLLCTVDAVFRL